MIDEDPTQEIHDIFSILGSVRKVITLKAIYIYYIFMISFLQGKPLLQNITRRLDERVSWGCQSGMAYVIECMGPDQFADKAKLSAGSVMKDFLISVQNKLENYYRSMALLNYCRWRCCIIIEELHVYHFLSFFFLNGIHISLIYRNHEHKALISNHNQNYEITSVINDVLHSRPKTNLLTHD